MPNPNNPYEFFMNTPPPKPATIINNNSFKQRILIVVGGAAILIIVLVVVFGVFLKGGNKGLQQLYEVNASQQDLIALTQAAKSEIKDRALQNTTASVSAVVNTQMVQTKAAIDKMVKPKISEAKIKALLDTTYQKSLDNAKTNNTYEATYTTLLANRLDAYRTKLSAAYSIITKQTLKDQLNSQYEQINQLKVSQ
jgi:hypothetical protein